MLTDMSKELNEIADPTAPVPRRALWRRIFLPRFSLRTMLILVTLFSCVAAWVGNWVYRSEKQRRAVAKINAMKDVFVAYDFDPYSDDLRHKRREVYAPKIFLDNLGVDYFHDAYRLHIVSTDEKDRLAALEAARDLPSLRLVNFFNEKHVRVTPAVLEKLAKLDRVEELVVCDNADESVISYDKYLNKLSRFRSLWLSGIGKSAYTYAAIANMQNLKELIISQPAELSELEKLSPLSKLRSLALFAQPCEDPEEDCDEVRESAKRLQLIVKQFPDLEELFITDVKELSELKILRDAKKLKKLYMCGVNLSDDKEPPKILPNVEIVFWP